MHATRPSKRYIAGYDAPDRVTEADRSTLQHICQRLGALLGLTAVDEFTPTAGAQLTDIYSVPSRTLLEAEAQALRISGTQDLYGGVVPYDFVRNKTITHPLFREDMHRPDGWVPELGGALAPFTLEGFSVFDVDEAREVAQDMLRRQAVRLKLANANAGRQQWVVRSTQELDSLLDEADWEGDVRHGLVVEQEISEARTLSVGQTEVGSLLISYCGQQYLTPNHRGAPVYGGSTLFVVRGDYEQLMRLIPTPLQKQAVRMTRDYEARVFRAYPTLFSSRRNYDVLYGICARGEPRMGVLEQSWRLGGASMAEIIALEAFCLDPTLPCVTTWTRERYIAELGQLEPKRKPYCLAPDEGGYIAKFAGAL